MPAFFAVNRTKLLIFYGKYSWAFYFRAMTAFCGSANNLQKYTCTLLGVDGWLCTGMGKY